MIKLKPNYSPKLFQYFSAVYAAVAIWLTVDSALQYLLTELLYYTNSVPDSLRLALLLLSIGIGFFILLRLEKRSGEFGIRKFLTFSIAFAAIIFIHSEYTKYFSELQRVPKIHSISKNWTIQGDRIAIEGRNFGEPNNENNRVYVGELDLQIQSWSNRRIVVEQPVYGEYFTGTLMVCNGNQICAPAGEFSIRDPAEVL